MKRIILILAFFMLSFTPKESGLQASNTSSEKLDLGEVIFSHVVDAYEWHIMTVGEKHISIPLPIILLHEGKLDIFMSSQFHHGTQAYRGYAIAQEGMHKGRIVCVDDQGNLTQEKPWDFSFTKTALAIFMSVALLCILLFATRRAALRNRGKAPSKFQSIIEMLVIFIRDDVAKPAIGERYTKFLPYLLTLFLFIFINNLVGILPFFPGGSNVTGNIGVTAILALFTFIIMSVNGTKHFWVDIFNTPGVPWWLKFPLPLLPVIELMSLITKPVVLMIRLFANMAAGHIIILGLMVIIFVFGNLSQTIGFLTAPLPVIFAVFMSLLELLVAFIQAYVFTLLSALYFGMAVNTGHATKGEKERLKSQE